MIRVQKGVVEIESKDPHMRSFLVPDGSGGNARVNVWESGLFYTVGTYMYHPGQKKKTQLFRKHCTLDQVFAILKNPRIHTGKGYRTKAEYERRP